MGMVPGSQGFSDFFTVSADVHQVRNVAWGKSRIALSYAFGPKEFGEALPESSPPVQSSPSSKEGVEQSSLGTQKRAPPVDELRRNGLRLRRGEEEGDHGGRTGTTTGVLTEGAKTTAAGVAQIHDVGSSFQKFGAAALWDFPNSSETVEELEQHYKGAGAMDELERELERLPAGIMHEGPFSEDAFTLGVILFGKQYRRPEYREMLLSKSSPDSSCQNLVSTSSKETSTAHEEDGRQRTNRGGSVPRPPGDTGGRGTTGDTMITAEEDNEDVLRGRGHDDKTHEDEDDGSYMLACHTIWKIPHGSFPNFRERFARLRKGDTPEGAGDESRRKGWWMASSKKKVLMDKAEHGFADRRSVLIGMLGCPLITSSRWYRRVDHEGGKESSSSSASRKSSDPVPPAGGTLVGSVLSSSTSSASRKSGDLRAGLSFF